MRLGRRILDNLRKALAYILAIHVPILGLTLIPIALGWPLMLLPVHIAFLQLVIDPACSVVFEAEPEEGDLMRRRPRRPGEPLFDRKLLVLSLLQGLSVLAAVIAVFAVAHYRGQGDADARALTFTTLIIANLGLILVNRSRSLTALQSIRAANGALWWVVSGTVAFLAAALYVPWLQTLFRFAPLHPIDLLVCLAAGGASIAWVELLKLVGARRRRVHHATI